MRSGGLMPDTLPPRSRSLPATVDLKRRQACMADAYQRAEAFYRPDTPLPAPWHTCRIEADPTYGTTAYCPVTQQDIEAEFNKECSERIMGELGLSYFSRRGH